MKERWRLIVCVGFDGKKRFVQNVNKSGHLLFAVSIRGFDFSWIKKCNLLFFFPHLFTVFSMTIPVRWQDSQSFVRFFCNSGPQNLDIFNF